MYAGDPVIASRARTVAHYTRLVTLGLLTVAALGGFALLFLLIFSEDREQVRSLVVVVGGVVLLRLVVANPRRAWPLVMAPAITAVAFLAMTAIPRGPAPRVAAPEELISLSLLSQTFGVDEA